MNSFQEIIQQIKSEVNKKYIHEKYEDCYVVFLDILGMKNLLEKEYSEVKKIFNVIEAALVLYGNTQIIGQGNFISKKQVRVSVMSDSIVISITKEVAQSFSKIIGISSYIISEVLNSLDEPIFIRGGISVGKLLHNDFSVFGPGLSKAYILECEKDKYMRCIIDKEIYKSSDFKNYIENTNSLTIDDDKFYIIDFITNSNVDIILDYSRKQIKNLRNKRIIEKYLQLIKFIETNHTKS